MELEGINKRGLYNKKLALLEKAKPLTNELESAADRVAILQLIASRGLTVSTLARKIPQFSEKHEPESSTDESESVPISYVSRHLNGDGELPVEFIARVCKAMGVSPEEFAETKRSLLRTMFEKEILKQQLETGTWPTRFSAKERARCMEVLQQLQQFGNRHRVADAVEFIRVNEPQWRGLAWEGQPELHELIAEAFLDYGLYDDAREQLRLATEGYEGRADECLYKQGRTYLIEAINTADLEWKSELLRRAEDIFRPLSNTPARLYRSDPLLLGDRYKEFADRGEHEGSNLWSDYFSRALECYRMYLKGPGSKSDQTDRDTIWKHGHALLNMGYCCRRLGRFKEGREYASESLRWRVQLQGEEWRVAYAFAEIAIDLEAEGNNELTTRSARVSSEAGGERDSSSKGYHELALWSARASLMLYQKFRQETGNKVDMREEECQKLMDGLRSRKGNHQRGLDTQLPDETLPIDRLAHALVGMWDFQQARYQNHIGS